MRDTTPTNSTDLTQRANQNISDTLTIALQHDIKQRAIVVFDQRCELAVILAAAYQHCLPDARFIDFDHVTPDAVLAEFAQLQPSDLVVLIQSTNFRLDAYRIRVELFKQHVKVIEHPHLARMSDEQIPFYIDALAYDPNYFRTVGRALKARIDQAQCGEVDTGHGAKLHFASPFESAKLNIGDYSDMTNVGGQFPIGEVFTEAQDLEAVHGKVRILVFGDTSFTVNKPEQAITLIVEKGRVVDVENSTPEFDLVLQKIRADEGEVWLRELGFGMNRAFSVDRTVNDIGTYERMCGIHLSLGAKHGVYTKPQIRRAEARYHVDVFAATETVSLDNEVIYRDGAWQVEC